MKTFKASCDCFIKICQSLKGRGISEFPNTVFRAIYVLPDALETKHVYLSDFVC